MAQSPQPQLAVLIGGPLDGAAAHPKHQHLNAAGHPVKPTAAAQFETHYHLVPDEETGEKPFYVWGGIAKRILEGWGLI